MEFPADYVVNMLKAHKVTQTEHALTDCWFVIAVMEGLAELMINGSEYVCVPKQFILKFLSFSTDSVQWHIVLQIPNKWISQKDARTAEAGKMVGWPP